MTTPDAHYPDRQVSGHDLDPNADGDLTIGPVDVRNTQAVLIAANSTDDTNWSASVEWVDDDGNTIQTESATDIALSGVDNDNARLTRKGPRVSVTFTSDAAGGTANTLNAYVDSHR